MKKWIVIAVVILSCISLFSAGFISGVFYGMDVTEDKAALDTYRLSKVINAIDAYFEKNKKYPTTPDFYNNELNCDLTLEYVNSEMVSLYCGVAGRNNYYIKFTVNGNITISRK